ncbi:MAG: response regulator [Candidatus Yonathbacteria bacterium]|nr:response regulator [Candidatus Yonathbacteria bacterium]
MNAKDKIILMVEDEVPMLTALADNFAEEGFSVLKAMNGVDGLNLALARHPDLILLDIVMPQMDGFIMLKKLRADEWGKKVPVFMLTNYSDNEKVAEALVDDVSEYFVKSDVKIEEIIARVKEKLGI